MATAAKWVPIMRPRGADIVLISAHGGDSGTSSYGPELPNENPSALIAEQVPGIDAILFGHAHTEVRERFVTNARDRRAGAAVRAVASGASGVTRMDFTLTRERGRWTITAKRATMLNTNTVAEDPKVRRGGARPSTTRPSRTSTRWSRTSAVELSAAESRYKDTPILDFINKVQTDTVTAALAGTAVRRPAGAVDRRAVQPHRGVPGRATSRSRTSPGCTSTTTRSRRSCSPAPRCGRTWSTRRSTSGRSRPGAPVDPAHDQRPGGAGLQLRHALRRRLRHRHQPAGRASGSPG